MSNKNNKEWMETPMLVTKWMIGVMFIMGVIGLMTILAIHPVLKVFMFMAWLTTGVWIFFYFENKYEQKRAERCKEDN